MFFDIKKNDNTTIECECHKCENIATNKLMLFGSASINICDKCLDNTVSKLSKDFEFNRI